MNTRRGFFASLGAGALGLLGVKATCGERPIFVGQTNDAKEAVCPLEGLDAIVHHKRDCPSGEFYGLGSAEDAFNNIKDDYEKHLAAHQAHLRACVREGWDMGPQDT